MRNVLQSAKSLILFIDGQLSSVQHQSHRLNAFRRVSCSSQRMPRDSCNSTLGVMLKSPISGQTILTLYSLRCF